MKTHIKRIGAQGDVILLAVSEIPPNAKLAEVHGSHYIIAHSETGHHHVIERSRAEVYEAADDAFTAFIRTLGSGADIIHQRPFDTHQTVVLEPNTIYRVHRQREYVAEGFRKAQD